MALADEPGLKALGVLAGRLPAVEVAGLELKLPHEGRAARKGVTGLSKAIEPTVARAPLSTW